VWDPIRKQLVNKAAEGFDADFFRDH
jgi:hypothetical protein